MHTLDFADASHRAMKLFDSIPRQAVEGWRARDVSHAAGEAVPFHYHSIEEWLEVNRGSLRFFTAGGQEFEVPNGRALQIPPGEVHRVDIGAEGVSYRMLTPDEPHDGSFSHQVSDELLALIEKNLALPAVENRWERRNRAEPSSADRQDEALLLGLLSSSLIFRTAKSSYLDRQHYLERLSSNPPVVRSTSGSVQILHQTSDTVLLSTTVETAREDGVRALFTNVRLFIREEATLKCRVWLNYPDPSV
jgi:quercetin dioxygenase-like cupin family protein